MYGFTARCGEYVEGIELQHRQIHFSCPKFCMGLTVSEDDVRELQKDLCDDCQENKNLEVER